MPIYSFTLTLNLWVRELETCSPPHGQVVVDLGWNPISWLYSFWLLLRVAKHHLLGTNSLLCFFFSESISHVPTGKWTLFENTKPSYFSWSLGCLVCNSVQAPKYECCFYFYWRVQEEIENIFTTYSAWVTQGASSWDPELLGNETDVVWATPVLLLGVEGAGVLLQSAGTLYLRVQPKSIGLDSQSIIAQRHSSLLETASDSQLLAWSSRSWLESNLCTKAEGARSVSFNCGPFS